MLSRKQLKTKIFKQKVRFKALKAELGLAYYELEKIRTGNRSLKNENDSLADRLKSANEELEGLRKPHPIASFGVERDAIDAAGNEETFVRAQ